MNADMKILIGYDGSDCANAALDDLSRAGLPAKADVVMLAAMEYWLPPPSGLEISEGWDHPKETRAVAGIGAARLRELRPEWSIMPEMSIGSPASVILEKADQFKPDLIVVGSHSRNAAGRFFFGSVSQKLVHDAHCTVRIARGAGKPGTDPIRLILAIDGSRGAQAAVDTVASRQWPDHTEVRLVNACWKLPASTATHTLAQIAAWIEEENARVKAAIDAAFSRLKAAGLHPSVVIEEDDPKELLLNEAEKWRADTLFVGARGMGRIERFLIGSVSSTIAARAHCSVEVVRPA